MLEYSESGLSRDFEFHLPELQIRLPTWKLLVYSCCKTIKEIGVSQCEMTSEWLPMMDLRKVADILGTLIEILETGVVPEKKADNDMIQELRKVISHLGLSKEVQWPLIKAYINVDNVCTWMALAKRGENEKVTEYCKRYVQTHRDDIFKDLGKVQKLAQMWPEWFQWVAANKFFVR